MKAETYVALVRGMNVGGHAVIKMSDLKGVFESLGFRHVTTVLASGNVVFQTPSADLGVLKQRIEAKLAKRIGVPIATTVRSGSQILTLLACNPFPANEMTPDTKLHVTFLGEQPKTGGKFPVRLPASGFQIVQVSAGEICSAFDQTPTMRTPELMKRLEKQFGRNITTRTWSTIEKIGKVLGLDHHT